MEEGVSRQRLFEAAAGCDWGDGWRAVTTGASCALAAPTKASAAAVVKNPQVPHHKVSRPRWASPLSPMTLDAQHVSGRVKILLADMKTVSTQQDVTLAAKAAPHALALVPALWGWMAVLVAVAILSWMQGGTAGAIAGATALGLAPALAGFVLAPRLDEGWAAAGLVGGLAACGGGINRGNGWPRSRRLAASVLIAPALTYALGCGKIAEAAAAGRRPGCWLMPAGRWLRGCGADTSRSGRCRN